MMFDLKKIIAGAAVGFFTALVVDVRKWSKWPKGTAFDWSEAVKTWIAGAVSGASAAFGIGAVGS